MTMEEKWFYTKDFFTKISKYNENIIDKKIPNSLLRYHSKYFEIILPSANFEINFVSDKYVAILRTAASIVLVEAHIRFSGFSQKKHACVKVGAGRDLLVFFGGVIRIWKK